MIRKLSYISALLTVIVSIPLLMLPACADDLLYDRTDIPEGEGVVNATVTFNPELNAVLGGTRTAGNAINTINSLCVLVYNTAGTELVRKYVKDATRNDFASFETSTNTSTSPDAIEGSGESQAEASTPQVKFTIPSLPFGRYTMYAVANMGDLSAYEEQIKTVEGLKNIQVTWQPGTEDGDGINENGVKKNDQMFGYFTLASEARSTGFNAPELVIRNQSTALHAWIKRLASKVTVAYDASGLNDGVWIYVKNVTLHDMAKTCYLGKKNEINNKEDLLNTKDNNNPAYFVPIANSRISYEESYPAADHIYLKDQAGIELYNGLVIPEHKEDGTTSFLPIIKGSDHSENANSLFFYENNQGIVENDKRQDPDKVGTNIREEQTDADGAIINDFKDAVKYGTYIEVEAYYVSNNGQNPSSGPIKYRFMLGKNITDDYNAQRNYHFKLTLGFKGWANQPDWHIDYEEQEPVLETPEDFRVSYLYHQRSTMPIKVSSNCTGITAEIIENNWAPFDPESPDGAPAASVGSGESRFQWNREAYTTYYYQRETYEQNGEQHSYNSEKPYLGFLALNMPNDATELNNPVTIPKKPGGGYYVYSDINAQPATKAQFEQECGLGSEKKSVYTFNNLSIGSHFADGELNYWNVYYVKSANGTDDSQHKIIELPLWTRAKTIIEDAGFSGNNPYEYYERRAIVKIQATYNVNGGQTTETKYVPIYQVRRIVNPKGVWRAYNENKSFNVVLLEAETPNGDSNFKPFMSDGEWTAYIDEATHEGKVFSLSTSSETVGELRDGKIYGRTGTKIAFKINFGAVAEGNSECAIIKVLYHGNQCVHKILVRKGYKSPIEIAGTKWSSFSLFRATLRNPTSNEDHGVRNDAVWDAELTPNPLMMGSMFRRGRIDKGIFVYNNQQPGLGLWEAPGSRKFLIAKQKEPSETVDNQKDITEWVKYWESEDWGHIGCVNHRTNYTTGCGTFYVKEGTKETKYKLPTYEQFKALTQSSEFAYGVVYGSAATEPATTSEDAYGLIDPQNKGLFDITQGMRGVMVYEKTTGNQIFFPMGKYGTGRRNNFIETGNNAGILRYSDVGYLLIDTNNPNNHLRPVPYNLWHSTGNIYWIDKCKQQGHNNGVTNSLGWDMNYFNFDFNPYTNNNYRDACPIKLVIDES